MGESPSPDEPTANPPSLSPGAAAEPSGGPAPAPAETAENPTVAEFRETLERYFFAGPLPLPHLLAEYKRVHPEAVDWIFETATKERERHEREQEHRHWIDREPYRLAARGQLFALIIAILGLLIGSGLVVYTGEPWGLFVTLVALAPIVGVFIYRERQDPQAHGEHENRPPYE